MKVMGPVGKPARISPATGFRVPAADSRTPRRALLRARLNAGSTLECLTEPMRLFVAKLLPEGLRRPSVAAALLSAVLVLATAALVAGPCVIGEHPGGPHLATQRVRETPSEPPAPW